jgi:cystathionine beta-lyase
VPVDPAPIRAATPWPFAGMDPADRFGVRLSIGIEDPADLIADLEQAFAAMARRERPRRRSCTKASLKC